MSIIEGLKILTAAGGVLKCKIGYDPPKGRQVEFGKFGLEGFSRVKKSVNLA